MTQPPQSSTLFPYTTLFRSIDGVRTYTPRDSQPCRLLPRNRDITSTTPFDLDRKSTRLNSSHGSISYAVFCLKKKKTIKRIYIKQPFRRVISTTHNNIAQRY